MASKGVNKVILIGNLGRDPEARYLPSGGAVTNISVATTDSWRDRQSGQTQERTEWHRVVFFNRLAEIAGEYLRKGSKVYIEGRLQTRKWQDKGGHDRYTTEIVANEMQMLGGRGGDDGDTEGPSPDQSYGNTVRGGSPGSGGPSGPGQNEQMGGGLPVDDDDIPFIRNDLGPLGI